MKRMAINTLVTILLVFPLLSLPTPIAHAQDADPPLTPPLRGPEDVEPLPLILPALSSLDVQADGLKGVAIVGDVGTASSNEDNREDIDQAVDALRSHGATVETFYYGERSFGWSDIVAAAAGANVLLYAGHGVWSSGTCAEPEAVGGFHLGGDDGYVSPEQICSDLAGRIDDDAVVILSRACFSAGDTACDGEHPAYPDWPTQAEAERRVRMYAAPFVDAGFKAYYANNYFGSAKTFVDYLLGSDPMTVGEVFKSVSPYDPNEFRDLTYPDASGYDLWLSGETGSWNHAFVGMPDHVFNADATPQLGPLPEAITFTHYLADASIFPATQTLVPENVGSDDSLTWEVIGSGDWFTITPTSGETSAASADGSGGFTITPTDADGVSTAGHTGTVTVNVTNPEGTVDAVQTIDVTLRSVAGSPKLVYLPLVMSD